MDDYVLSGENMYGLYASRAKSKGTNEWAKKVNTETEITDSWPHFRVFHTWYTSLFCSAKC